MATIEEWVAGARPRTLPAALSPVLVGTAAAQAGGHADPGLALLALAVALTLQVGVNYANDYSDGIRGTDEQRVGPIRLVGQRLTDPSTVKLAAYTCFFFAGVFGLALVALSGHFWLLLVGLAAIVAAWRYTGGDQPYGYRGLGEVFVFVFFGLVATLGTELTQLGRFTLPGLLGAVGCGALSSAILVANNLRDIPTDAAAGKRTLAVRLGDPGSRRLWLALVGLAFGCGIGVILVHWQAVLVVLALPLVVRPWRTLAAGATGRDLVPVLVATGHLLLGYAVALAAGLVWASAQTG